MQYPRRVHFFQVPLVLGAEEAARQKEAREALVKSFEQDSNVQKVLSHFSGKISTDSVLPLKE